MPEFLTPKVKLPPRDLSQIKSLELGLAIDKSDSMIPWRDQVIEGHNILITEQKRLAPNFRVSQVQFGYEVETIFDSVPVSQTPLLSQTNYRIKGSTALLDGIGTVMKSIGERFDAAELAFNVLIAILSDGAENASNQFTLEQIQDEIAFRRDEDGWQFVFLAAGYHSAQYARQLGIENIVQIDGPAIHATLARLSSAITQYRLDDTKRFFLGP